MNNKRVGRLWTLVLLLLSSIFYVSAEKITVTIVDTDTTQHQVIINIPEEEGKPPINQYQLLALVRNELESKQGTWGRNYLKRFPTLNDPFFTYDSPKKKYKVLERIAPLQPHLYIRTPLDVASSWIKELQQKPSSPTSSKIDEKADFYRERIEMLMFDFARLVHEINEAGLSSKERTKLKECIKSIFTMLNQALVTIHKDAKLLDGVKASTIKQLSTHQMAEGLKHLLKSPDIADETKEAISQQAYFGATLLEAILWKNEQHVVTYINDYQDVSAEYLKLPYPYYGLSVPFNADGIPQLDVRKLQSYQPSHVAAGLGVAVAGAGALYLAHKKDFWGWLRYEKLGFYQKFEAMNVNAAIKELNKLQIRRSSESLSPASFNTEQHKILRRFDPKYRQQISDMASRGESMVDDKSGK